MSWNGKAYGETGKGDKDRSNREKVSAQMEVIQNDENVKKVCRSCSNYKGNTIIDMVICKEDVKRNIAKDEWECDKWKGNR